MANTINSVHSAFHPTFRNHKTINQAITEGLIKPRSMASVTLYAEQRPVHRPMLGNHFAAYVSGNDRITEIQVHVDGITLKVWEKRIDGTSYVKESHNLGLDIDLLWARFESDVHSGKAQLQDDSGTFQRFLSKNIKFRDAKTGKLRDSTICRRDGISLMVRWLNRQTRFVYRQQDILMRELNAMGENAAWDSFADCPEDNEGIFAKRLAEGTATQLEATLRNMTRRANRLPTIKASEVLDAAPRMLQTKQARMVKLEGNYRAGIGGRGQLDRYRSAPRRAAKVSSVVLYEAMIKRQTERAQAALDAGDCRLCEALLRIVDETTAKLNAANEAAKQAQEEASEQASK
jgi:hypothetical protein